MYNEERVMSVRNEQYESKSIRNDGCEGDENGEKKYLQGQG